jgi:hypothetical protein
MFVVCQQLVTMLETVNTLDNNYTQYDAAAMFAAMPTCATNTDGSLGTADSAPVSGNVIDVTKVSRLNIAMSAYEIGVMVNLLQELVHLLDGVAVATQQYAPSVLAKTATE